jgi:hypothetical protein
MGGTRVRWTTRSAGGSRPQVRVEAWETGVDEDKLTAVCLYGGCTHRRTVVFYKQAGQVDVLDTIDAGPGVHTAEQFWHFGAGADDCLELPEGGEVERGRGGRTAGGRAASGSWRKPTMQWRGSPGRGGYN